jgi:hypothetical protein
VSITRDRLNDILLETTALSSDNDGNTVLLLHDGSLWVVMQDEEDPDYFFIDPMEFAQC